MRCATRSSLLASVLLCWSLVIHGQAFDFRCLSQANGLPSAGIYHLAEDSLGRLLIGTEGGGFARFDGERFSVWDHTNGLNADTIRCLLPSVDGTVWLGADGGGLWRFSNDRFSVVESPILNRTEIRSLAETPDGALWIATVGRGLMRMHHDQITREENLASINVRALLTDHSGTLYIGTDDGLFVHEEGRFVPLVHHADRLPSLPVYCLFQDNRQRIWAGTDRGVVLVVGKTWQSPALGLVNRERVRTISQDQQGDLWFGTQNGVFEFEERNGNIHHYTTDSGLSNNRIRNIYRDRSGTLWFSTYFGGICQLTSQAVVFFNREQGFPQSPINAVSVINDTSIWLGTFDGAVFNWTEGSRPKRIYQSRTLAQTNMITAMAVEQRADGPLLHFASEYDGLISLHANGRRLPPDPSLPGRWVTGEVFAIVPVDKQLVIAGHQAIRLPQQTITAQQLGAERLTALAEHNGIFFIGTSAGLYKLSLDGAPPEIIDQTAAFEISAVAVDHTGKVWFGTMRDGLYRFSNGKVSKMAPRQLPDNRVIGLSLDPVQDLWVATRKGITQLQLDPSQEIILGNQTFGPEHGLTGQIIGQAMTWDGQGHLWMGTSRGLFRLDPEGVFNNPAPPQMRITGIRLFYEAADWSEHRHEGLLNDLPVRLILPHERNHITFDFKAIDLSDPESVIFQCKLEGYDPEWIDLGRRKSHTYPVLPSGEYTFLLRSRNSSGIWNETPLSFSFLIRPPFYASPWFIAVVVLSVVFGVLLVFRLRLRRLRIRNEELERTVSERTNELAEAKEKSDRLLLNILPAATAEELKETGTAKARRYPNASVLFSDLKGFTAITEKISPDELVKMLDDTFRSFDAVCDRYGIEKIKTMGDAYMCACGLPYEREDHAVQLVHFAFEMLAAVEAINQRYNTRNLPEINIRIGIHSGSVISGVVGDKKFAYDIWGDTVNIASRMESSGKVGHINISHATYLLVRDHFSCNSRGKVHAKNKGEMEMYFVSKPEIL